MRLALRIRDSWVFGYKAAVGFLPVRFLTLLSVLSLSLLSAGGLALDRWISHAEIPDLSTATSVTVLDRDLKLLRAYTVDGGRWRLPTTADDVDRDFLRYLIAYEDKRFYRHRGVDPYALARAAFQAIGNGQIVSGGSTLTMQVARLLENSGTGRWKSKFRQIQLALALERRLSKTEILALYLKIAPYGGNLEGIRAASLSYFAKEPRRLTPAQSALLVALPQSPESRRPDRAPKVAKSARSRVLAKLLKAGVLDADAARAANRETMPAVRFAFPATAAHLADRITSESPGVNRHVLTVAHDLQANLETLTARHAVQSDSGLSAAIVVLDHENGEVLASVGSAGYLDHDRQGFIDMTRAIRSPGSTLKPFIYGLAFEAGIAHPETLINDRPMTFGAYAPRNFDKQFYGTLSARAALQHSLNIPAVALLEAVGPQVLLSRFRRAGVQAKLPGVSPPGLAIALGGLGLSLHDLVVLYGALARGGQAIEPRFSLSQVQTRSSRRLMSPVAAWQVADILTGVKGPKLARRGELGFKTGTSYGYRDAWAIGFDGRHVVGVWVGRPDGASVTGLLGSDTAAPLLFEAFEYLKPKLVPLRVPPAATLIVSHVDLPQPLKNFHGPSALFEKMQDKPEISFPPNGARIEMMREEGQNLPLVLKLQNGFPPFTWIANGKPFLIGSNERQVEFTPDGPGFVEVSVIDASGQSQNARFELR